MFVSEGCQGASLAVGKRPIGIFDSGLGGLTVVREIRKQLPEESITYFGDLARLPYGIKSKEQILRFSVENTRFLLSQSVKAVVIACNSSASAAYPYLKKNFHVPIVDVIGPAVEAALSLTRTGRVGLIATQATVESGAYTRALACRAPKAKLFSQPCPMLVPVVEAGWLRGTLTDQIIRKYLEPLKRWRLDTLILGCTHYPLLRSGIQRALGHSVRLIDSAQPTVQKLVGLLTELKLNNPGRKKGSLKVFVSDLPRDFKRIGERFLGEKLNHVKVIRNSHSAGDAALLQARQKEQSPSDVLIEAS